MCLFDQIRKYGDFFLEEKFTKKRLFSFYEYFQGLVPFFRSGAAWWALVPRFVFRLRLWLAPGSNCLGKILILTLINIFYENAKSHFVGFDSLFLLKGHILSYNIFDGNKIPYDHFLCIFMILSLTNENAPAKCHCIFVCKSYLNDFTIIL